MALHSNRASFVDAEVSLGRRLVGHWLSPEFRATSQQQGLEKLSKGRLTFLGVTGLMVGKTKMTETLFIRRWSAHDEHLLRKY